MRSTPDAYTLTGFPQFSKSEIFLRRGAHPVIQATPDDDCLNLAEKISRSLASKTLSGHIRLGLENWSFACLYVSAEGSMENKATELNASIRRTIEQLANETDAARQSQLFRDYLKTSAAFWDYSWHNQMLIWRQKPDASFVGGFNTWLKCGRYVRKGEKGIAILAPMFFKDKRQNGDGTDAEVQRIWFKVVYVFDISQTDGAPLPELPTRSFGERGQDMLNRLLRFAESRGITVRFVEKCSLNGAVGTSRGAEIEIRTSETDATTQAATLAHEIAHSLLHFKADGKRITNRDGQEIDKRQRELEAEATAYVVCSYFGIQSPSNFYLATYRVTSAMMLEGVETIAATVKTILSGCQEPAQLCSA
jgi:antirestriction protein ArdC